MGVENRSGKMTLLRVHDVGTGWGPPSDSLDVEVIIKLDSRPDEAYGFQLRDDGNRPVRQGMLDLLRDAFEKGSRVSIDVDIVPGRKNARLFRVWVEPQREGVVGGSVLDRVIR
jgi:hypothetical protein